MKRIAAPLVILCALTSSSFGEALNAQSSASDISANVQVTGSLLGLGLGTVAVNLTPLSSASGTAPAIYDNTPPSLVSAGSKTSGLLTVNLGAAATEVRASSDVDGSEGTRFSRGQSSLTNATAGIGLDLGLLGDINLLSVGFTGSPLTVITSVSNVQWDGISVIPTGGSDFLTSGKTLTLSVLGIALVIPAYDIDGNAEVTVNVPLGTGTVTGTIGISVDDFQSSILGNTASSQSTSVLLDLDLNITVGLGTSIVVDGDVAINQSQAQLTAVPVPEPSVYMATALSVGALLSRRSRRS